MLPLDATVDRTHREAALAAGAAWIAFITGLLVGGELKGPASFAWAGAIGAAFVIAGFAAAGRCRRLPHRLAAQRVRLALLSIAAGIGLGLANLAANRLIAAAHPRLRELLVERMTTLDPLIGVVTSPIVEEVAVRLFLMSAIAWTVSRVTKREGRAMSIALVGSAFIFALLHLDRPLPDDPVLSNVYRAALVAKYTAAGLPLGWIFWRWGLPYAILCHVAANAVHLAVQEGLF